MNISDALNNLSAKCAENAPESFYIGEDNLKHCFVCHEQLESRVPFGNGERIMPCVCRCFREKEALEKQQVCDLEKQKRINALREKAIPYHNQREIRFSNATDQDEKHIKAARWYVDTWTEHKENGMGLIFLGNVGMGKTFVALCIANALIDLEVNVRVTDFRHILNELTSNATHDKNAVIDEYVSCDLLIIDDLGAEYQTDFTLQYIEQIIDGCYNNGTPFIFTTNTSLSDMKNPSDTKYSRIYSRILGRAVPIVVTGEDRRVKQGSDYLKKMQQSLQSYVGRVDGG